MDLLKTKALDRLRRKITIETLWLYIISVLKDEPTYAYDVKVRIREKFGFNPTTITLYVVLYRLVKEGLLEVFVDEGVKKYKVTRKGENTYNNALKMINELLEKLRS